MQIIKINDKDYVIHETYNFIQNESILKQRKKRLGYDIILKNNHTFYLCNEIVDVEVMEYITENVKTNIGNNIDVSI